MISKALTLCLFALITITNHTQVSEQTTNSVSEDMEFVVETSEQFKYSFLINSESYELEDSYYIEKLKTLISNEYNPSFIEIIRVNKSTTVVNLVLEDENQFKILQRFIEDLGFTILESKKPVLND